MANTLLPDGCGDTPLNQDNSTIDSHTSSASGDCSIRTQSLPNTLSNLAISPNNIVFASNGSATCLDPSIDTLTEILGFIETNIVAVHCDMVKSSCNILVSEEVGADVKVVARPLAQVLASCLNLSAANPHMVYDDASKSVVAGNIDISVPDCGAFQTLLTDCVPEAPNLHYPAELLGYRNSGSGFTAEKFKVAVGRQTKFWATIPLGLNTNKHTLVASGARLLVNDSLQQEHENTLDNGSFDAAETRFRAGAAGSYRVNISIMVNTRYQTLSGWLVSILGGLLLEQYSVNAGAPPQVEYRFDQRMLNLGVVASDGQDVTLSGSITIPMGANDRITPRVWFATTHDPSGAGNRTVDLWINRSATTVFSVSRIPDYDIGIIG